MGYLEINAAESLKALRNLEPYEASNFLVLDETTRRNLELEATWIGWALRGKSAYSFLPSPPRREAFAAMWDLMTSLDEVDIPSRDDPVPGLIEIANIVSDRARWVRRRVWQSRLGNARAS